MLSGIEDVPSEAHWRALGEGVVPILFELANDPSEPPYVRLRAVGATASFPSPATRAFLVAVTRVQGQTDLMIAEAVRALGRRFGPAALRDVTPLLAHREPLVREAAARALAGMRTPAARSALQERLRVERDLAVREALQVSLQR